MSVFDNVLLKTNAWTLDHRQVRVSMRLHLASVLLSHKVSEGIEVILPVQVLLDLSLETVLIHLILNALLEISKHVVRNLLELDATLAHDQGRMHVSH